MTRQEVLVPSWEVEVAAADAGNDDDDDDGVFRVFVPSHPLCDTGTLASQQRAVSLHWRTQQTDACVSMSTSFTSPSSNFRNTPRLFASFQLLPLLQATAHLADYLFTVANSRMLDNVLL